MGSPSLIRNAALVAVSLLAGLLVCEAGVRIAGVGGMIAYQPDPTWGYTMRPEQRVYVYGHPVDVNSLGFRGPELSAAKSPGSVRIVFLGDSVTYGGGQAREEEIFVRRIEADLRRAGTSVEALNISASGWSPQNWIAFVEHRGLYEADIVVAVIPEVDLERQFATMEHSGLRERAPLLQLSRFLIKSGLMSVDVDLSLWEGVDPTAEAAKNVAAVRKLIDMGEHAGAAVVLVLLPSLPTTVDPDRWLPYERFDVPIVDLRPVLVEPEYFFDGIHLTSTGHAVVAENIGPVLRQIATSRR